MADERAVGIGRVVGIDLGTTNSLVAFMQGGMPGVIPGEDGERLVSSVVAWTVENGLLPGFAKVALAQASLAGGCGPVRFTVTDEGEPVRKRPSVIWVSCAGVTFASKRKL